MANKKRIIITGVAAGAAVLVFIILAASRKNSEVGQSLSRFFPLGEQQESPTMTSEENSRLSESQEQESQAQAEKPTVTRITQNAISGATFYNGKIRFIEKATGHLYESESRGENLTRISNTTIPGIFEVLWSASGDSAILKYLRDDNLRIFSARFAASSTQGIFLPPQISTIAASPFEDKIFYIMPAGEANAGITASFEDTNKKQVLSLPFGEFTANWFSQNYVSLTTKPSASTDGFLYTLNLTNSFFEKNIGNIKGLQALRSPNNNKTIISGPDGKRGIKLSLFDSGQKTLLPLPVNTLAEKCVWSQIDADVMYCGAPSYLPQATLPDDWLKGTVAFGDGIVKIDAKTGKIFSVPLYEFESFFDITHPFLNNDDSFLFFTDKVDGTLWSIKLK